MEIPEDSPKLKKRRPSSEHILQKPALQDHLALLSPPVPIKISDGFKKTTPHTLPRMTELMKRTSKPDVNPTDRKLQQILQQRKLLRSLMKTSQKSERESSERDPFEASGQVWKPDERLEKHFLSRPNIKGFPLEIPQEIVHQYKRSIIQKYESEQSFFSGKEELLPALYTQPLIIQKKENGSFQNIRVDMFFRTYTSTTVILQGDSGSGKFLIAQKIMLDWASERIFLSFIVVFCLRCEELMCISEEMNLIEILSCSCSLTSDQISQMLLQSPEKVLFIIDGFDELRLTEDIYDMSPHTDPLQKAPTEVIICGLMRRYLIPESNLLVTTRTKNTVNKLLNGQQRVTEIVGFSASQVKRYFQKFNKKEFDCVRVNKTLFTACSIPVICWIISEMFRVGAKITSGLETTTSIYVDFVSTLLEHHCQGLSQSIPSLLRSLGQLAERGMLQQQVLFDEKSVETMSDPAGSSFLHQFLIKRIIHQETMYGFMHRSFQEFFTALYYVLLDEEESQRKVRELLHTVERGWTLSCWSDRDFSMADVEVRHSELLQPVILFLCGLCKKEWIPLFFEKHNMAVSINIETQLKEWLNQCSQRYQNEHMLFILHCLYELHEKSFVGKVVEGLILIDLSDIPLKMTDCWVLKYCLQCCEHIRNLKLHVTSENLKMLQPELYRCKELWLTMDHISDEVDGLISAASKGMILNKLNIKMFGNLKHGSFREVTLSVREEDITLSFNTPVNASLTLSCPSSVVSIINWAKSHTQRHLYSGSPYFSSDFNELMMFLKSLSGLKKVHLKISGLNHTLSSEILLLIKASPSLTELRINDIYGLESLEESLKQIDWTMTVWRNLVLIKPDGKSFTEEKLKMKKEKSKRKEEESSDSGPCSSIKAESSVQSSSEDAEVFTPELIQRDDEKHKKTYRFVSPHAGWFRCSLTNLVFVMEGEGEVLYKVVSWDPRLLDGLGQMQPAGPLYSIDCSTGSISRLHFPHCEISEENKECLAVAHFTGGNIEVKQPFNVTDTHVITDIRDLSLFGLIKKIFSGSPIGGQVLLFLRSVTVEPKQKVLHVHLLPGNVPVSEVQHYHKDKKYIETSSKCHLFPGRKYSVCCQPEECEVQPKSETFEFGHFGPNYHPTFEVFLDVNIEEVRLGVLDEMKDEKEVWNRRRILLSAPSQGEEPPALRMTESKFVNKHRDKLIQRVSSVMAIADGLRSKNMIPDEMYSKVRAVETRQEKMRLLLDVFDSGGASVKAEFYRLLKEKEPHLVDELESGSSGVQ